jgi:cellulose synthase/poly-beta-1,6-N-acetylglucosamine synthase-like glycosyltransferase
MTVLFATYLACSCVAIVYAFLWSFQTWEHRRFSVSRTSRPQIEGQNARVALIAPCKGIDLELQDNLARLFEQDYANYELLLVVDSPDDPACPLLQRLVHHYCSGDAQRDKPTAGSIGLPAAGLSIGETGVATGRGLQAQIFIAGPARDCSQKIHNLRTAIQHLGPEVEVLAFVDSDTRPERDWLRQLVRRLRAGVADAATSYRWFVPLTNRFPNLLLASLDHSLAPMAGPAPHHLVWGGSWAIRRETFDAIGLDAAWSTALSDDLVASKRLAQAGAEVEYEPAAMVASPVDMSWLEMFHFLRRQFAVVRWHEPFWWSVGLTVSLVNQLFFWASLAAGLALSAVGNPHAWAPLATVAVLYGWNVYRAWLRQSASRYFLPEWDEQLRMVGSAIGRNVLWRGIRYAPLAAGAVQILPPRNEEGFTIAVDSATTLNGRTRKSDQKDSQRRAA